MAFNYCDCDLALKTDLFFNKQNFDVSFVHNRESLIVYPYIYVHSNLHEKILCIMIYDALFPIADANAMQKIKILN